MGCLSTRLSMGYFTMNRSDNCRYTFIVLTVLVTAVALVGCPPPRDNGTDNGDPPDNRVTVPDVVGMTEADARGNLLLADLVVGDVTLEYSNEVSEGNVISQSPRADNTVNRGSAVNLVVSKGPEPVTVPDVVGMTEADAQGNLVLAGLTVGNVTSDYSEETPEGSVISQSPRAGNSVNQGSAVNLVVSLGPETAAGEEVFLLPGNVPLRMIWIESGTFMMGRNPGEQDGRHFEDPQHEVTIAYDFWMGRYTVTKRQWQAVMGTTPWAGRTRVLDHLDSPAVYISWNDARDFITALNAHIIATGQGTGDFRLPSEAEWEYACRAGTTTRFYWGDDPEYTQIDSFAWWRGNAWDLGNLYAHVVGQKLPNAWGLYDMSGNVREWCEDDWGSYRDAPADGSAWVDSPRATYRVCRGGSWLSAASHSRSAFRALTGEGPEDTHNTIGFRLAR